MKWQRYIPSIPSIAIALSALLLGIVVAVRYLPYTLIYRSRSQSPGVSSLSAAGIAIFALVIVALVIVKSLSDWRYQVERDLLEAFLNHIPDNVFFKDRNSRFLRASRSMANYFGLDDPAQIVNKSDSDFFSPEHADRAFTDEQEVLRTGQAVIGIEEKETWPDGRENWVLTTKVPLKNHRGQVIGTMGISHDITDRKQAEVRIHHMALHDALTGLPNRGLLEDRLSQAIALATRYQKRVAVFMLDLDRFKNVNDSFGHYVGDRLLESVSTRLRGCVRESDILARLGGDEFVVALPMAGDKKDIERVAKKIQGTLAEPFEIEGHQLKIGASIGICEHPADGDNPETLLQIADFAMYEAKKRGRGTYSFFSPELTEATRHRQKLGNDLHLACARNEFVLHYQPMVSTVTGRITGVEALLRWLHPEQGLISPNQFIPQLEELGLMAEVGLWVLRTACEQNVAWQKEGLPSVRMAVNLSSQQFYLGDIVRSVETVLRETGLDPKWLEIELTESLTLDNSETTIRIMRDLKKLGISLSLDDFGTGWSSLSYLRRFQFDRIKIDHTFLRDIALQPAAETVVRNIIDLGRNLGLACVAEGVETRQQFDYLQSQMCPEVQGFLYSHALPAADCAALLGSGRPDFLNTPAESANGFNIADLAPMSVS